MADVVLFHHAQGLTPGMRSFADRLQGEGHAVTMPDLFEGARFATVDEGVAHARGIGFDEIVVRGEAAVAELPSQLVYVGFSLGVLPAQKLVQNRPGALAAVLMHGAVPLDAFGGTWPVGVPLQIHAHADDDWAEVPELEELSGAVPGAELHLYPGSSHLFSDVSLADYDEANAELAMTRILALLRSL